MRTLSLLLVLVGTTTADNLLVDPPPAADNRLVPVAAESDRPYDPGSQMPAGAWKYTPARYTQRIATTNGRPTIAAVPIALMPDTRWHASGGLLGVKGWRSEKWKWTPTPEREWVAPVAVKNSFGDYQHELGLVRRYPDQTEFHDVLVNTKTGKVFEHRRALKRRGKWERETIYHDPQEYPEGYAGLKVTCASCHREAGTGGYAVGLVPGGDTILSDPWDWSLARGY